MLIGKGGRESELSVEGVNSKKVDLDLSGRISGVIFERSVLWGFSRTLRSMWAG